MPIVCSIVILCKPRFGLRPLYSRGSFIFGVEKITKVWLCPELSPSRTKSITCSKELVACVSPGGNVSHTTGPHTFSTLALNTFICSKDSHKVSYVLNVLRLILHIQWVNTGSCEWR